MFGKADVFIVLQVLSSKKESALVSVVPINFILIEFVYALVVIKELITTV